MSVALRWMVSVAALLVLIGCADARRVEKQNPLVMLYEDRGYEYAGETATEWWFLDGVTHGTYNRTWWTYLVVEKGSGEERTVLQPWPEEFE